jgi:thiol-disulfide isomerase/thioredoxin
MRSCIPRFTWILAVALAWVIWGGGPAPAELQEAGRAGETLDPKTLPVSGKVTLVEFTSPYCGPCLSLAPLLEQLSAKRPDLAIKKININRPEVKTIDWRSPVAQQYGIRSVPYIVIFDSKGKVMAQGRPAMQQLSGWLVEAGLLKMGEKGKQ